MDHSPEGVGFLCEASPESPYFLIDFGLGGIDRAQQLARTAWKRELNRYAKHGCEVLAYVEEL